MSVYEALYIALVLQIQKINHLDKKAINTKGLYQNGLTYISGPKSDIWPAIAMPLENRDLSN